MAPPSVDLRANITEVVWLGGALAITLLLSGTLHLYGTIVAWFASSSWLFGCSLLLLRRSRAPASLFRGGDRVWLPAVLIGGLVSAILAMCLLLAFRTAGDNHSVWPSIALVTIVPLGEELYFRGLLLAHLKRTLGSGVALVMSSLLFGFIHLPQGTFVVMTLLALLIGWLTLRTRSVLWAIAIHMGWNALAQTLVLPTADRVWFAAATSLMLITSLSWGLGTRTKRVAA